MPSTTARPSRPYASSSSGSSGGSGSPAGRRGGRPTGGGRPNPGRSRQTSSRPAPAPRVSELELALLAAADNAPAAEGKTFAELGLPAALVRELARGGIEAPFAIQTRTLPDALAGRDVLGRAQTGSGKTLGFGLPMLARLADGERLPGRPRGLVLVPTRELAKQVSDALYPLAKSLGLRVTSVYGGAPIRRQIEALERGVDIVIATPGRLIDLIERRSCRLDRIAVTILDEADHMADLGFMPAVTQILDLTPEGEQRMLFSATLDGAVEKLVVRYLNNPALHAVKQVQTSVNAMDHHVFTVRADDKLAVTAEIVARPGRTLLFVRTKHGADRLAKQLERAGVNAAAIHGDLKQNARQRALDGFTAGSPRVLVATDVAARGIHVDDVDLVIHFDPPADHKDYLHRSGRTARAGNTGTVLMLAGAEQLREVKRLHEGAGVTATSTTVFPGHDEVRRIAESGTAPAPIPVRHPSSPRRPSEGGRPASRHSGPRTPRDSAPSTTIGERSSERFASDSQRRGGPTGANVDGSRRHQRPRRPAAE
ncbi:DEAD/DEAH box helicase [Acidothermaceae bacterium B102]|nr:DEAD/DEAH box helicase [Acidothermaceae bacterium B102]